MIALAMAWITCPLQLAAEGLFNGLTRRFLNGFHVFLRTPQTAGRVDYNLSLKRNLPPELLFVSAK